MTKSNITQYDNTAANNTDVEDVPLGENLMYPAHVNNAFREIMADLADINDGTVALTSPQADSLTVTGDLTVDTDTLHVDSTNNRVGIGTSAPTNPLTVSSSSELVAKFASTDETSGIDIADDTSYARITNSDGLFRIDANDDGGGSSTIFSVATAGTERMRIDGSGNVGIGTTSPTASLMVNGGGTNFPIVVNSTDQYAGIAFADNTTTSNAHVAVYADGNELGFEAGNAERMRIDSSGRLLVGSTVSNGAGSGTIVAGDAGATSGGVALQVKYTADDSVVNYGSQYSSGDALIGHGVASSQTTANTFISTADNAAFARGALTVGDELKFYNASGQTTTKGSTVSMTERMKVSSSGVLTVGGNTVWHAGNDGSGSGLDADTLDGVQGSSYLRSDATDTTTGYFTVDNHFRVQNAGVSGQGDNNTHFNYQNTGINYVRGTQTFFSSPAKFTTETAHHANIDMCSDDNDAARYIHMPRGGGITFYGDDSTHHSITSRNNGGSSSDDLTISSYGAVYIKLDNNNNNTSSADFIITQNGNTSALFKVDGESGDVTVTGEIDMNGYDITDIDSVHTQGESKDVKFAVYSGSTYGVGMTSGITLGFLNDWAMTHCMNNDSDRGFWWGYSGQSKSSGAMSLTTDGRLFVSKHVTVGTNQTSAAQPAIAIADANGQTSGFNTGMYSPTMSLADGLGFAVGGGEAVTIRRGFGDGWLAAGTDNSYNLGYSSKRWKQLYAGTTTINTSDENQKQQIAALTDAEITAATAISKLFRTYKWNDAVEEKGDNARTHTGVIAQQVKQAMTDAGLDAANYAFFCSDTWWTDTVVVDPVEGVAAVYDDDGNMVTEGVDEVIGHTYTVDYFDEDEAPDSATKHTMLGIRYPDLLSFISAATEQRLTDIETRLTALES